MPIRHAVCQHTANVVWLFQVSPAVEVFEQTKSTDRKRFGATVQCFKKHNDGVERYMQFLSWGRPENSWSGWDVEKFKT